ncbi:cupin domain-containing protein [Salinithrix halophila]|uniref:Cupin domain-containing protein n=1 Tax=Salinithrix halophila TaxID=1485204 RepID=A0ABV8JKS2_9BACL
MKMYVQKLEPEFIVNDYGVQLRYLYPNQDITVPTPFEAAWVIVESGQSTDPHHHHDAETFFIVEGSGVMNIDDEARAIGKGDVVYIPAFSKHQISNPHDARLVFITVSWDIPQEGGQ